MTQTVVQALLSFAMFFCSLPALADFSGSVTAIHDGDTLHVKVAGTPKPLRVRLWGVDTPEIDFMSASQGDWAYGARDYLKSLLPIGAIVTIKTGEMLTDKANRALGTVIYQGRDINALMLKSGWAFLYIIAPYEKGLTHEYSMACHEAAQRRRGVFDPRITDELEPYFFRLKVQKKIGFNIMGDLSSKRLIPYNSQRSVHPCDRVFFASEDAAQAKGFSF